MAFRSFVLSVTRGTPQQVLVADHGDVEVQIRTSQDPTNAEAGAGYDFEVGGPDIGTTGGMVCFSGEFRSEVSPGDEIWVKDVDAPTTISVTVLVRSR